MIERLVTSTASQLLVQFGICVDTAAEILIVGDNPPQHNPRHHAAPSRLDIAGIPICGTGNTVPAP